MNLKASFTLVFLLLISTLMQGCGFHLRGHQPLDVDLKAIYIDTSSPYSNFTRQLKQVLRSLKVMLVEEPNQAQLTLKLISQRIDSTTLSQSASANTKEYLLSFKVTYQLQNSQGTLVYGPKTITTSRNLIIMENEVLSSNNQQAMLKQDMQRDAVYQLLNQLSSQEVATIISQSQLNYSAKIKEARVMP